MRRRRDMPRHHILVYLKHHWHRVVIVSGLFVAIVVLLASSYFMSIYWRDLSVNIAADLIGVVVALVVINPFIARAELRIDSVLDRFDHRAFIRQVLDARRQILILTTWTDLLQSGYRDPFLDSLQTALNHGVEVRILLLAPDSMAAEQRTNDLQQRTNVVEKIYENLQDLHTFQRGFKSLPEGRFEIRIYSALPPVQLYQADDHIVVSFYPLNSTSWHSAQYQTSPYAQLGAFVNEKFNELWDAPSTRMLDQFWTISISVRVELDDNPSTYLVDFVALGEAVYVCGQSILSAHPMHELDGLRGHIIDRERELVRLYSFVHLEINTEECKNAQQMFGRKYGRGAWGVILKLVEVSPTAAS